jgi:hypothetical protein
MAREKKSVKSTEKLKKQKENAEQLKAFKASSEVSDFYRFVHENNLRHEAKVLLETVHSALYTSSGKRKTKILQ